MGCQSRFKIIVLESVVGLKAGKLIVPFSCTVPADIPDPSFKSCEVTVKLIKGGNDQVGKLNNVQSLLIHCLKFHLSGQPNGELSSFLMNTVRIFTNDYFFMFISEPLFGQSLFKA